MQKLLTIVIPTYNMQDYLHRCLYSLVLEDEQLMSQLEVLVINDGSKDRSSEIGHEYEAKYPDVIRVIDKENGNYGSCVNRALAEATGKYFRMLDADDWCDTSALNQWVEYLKACNADMVLTVAEDRDESGNLIQRLAAPRAVQEEKVYTADEFDGIKLGYTKLFCSHIVTYKTSILREIGLQLQHGISYTDNEYVFFPLDHVQTIIYYNLPVYQYFVGREGQTTQPEILMKQAEQILQVFKRLYDYYNLHKISMPESVLNNQRIVLSEMLNWIYSPLFRDPASEGKKNRLMQLESIVRSDAAIYAMTGNRQVMLSFYRKTGLYIDSYWAIAYKQLHRVISAITRRLF